MKNQVIEAAGKAWRFLGQNGEVNVSNLPKVLKEKETVVFQALGWLAREDKINYSIKNRRTFVSLVDQELKAFNGLMYKIEDEVKSVEAASTKGRTKGKK